MELIKITLIVSDENVQGCAKKLVPGCEKSSAQLQSAQARRVLNKRVTFLCTTLHMGEGISRVKGSVDVLF